MNKLPIIFVLTVAGMASHAQTPPPNPAPASPRAQSAAPQNAAIAPQWMRARDDFPAPPGQQPAPAATQTTAATQTQVTGYGAGVNAPPPALPSPTDHNGIAPLPPLVPPPGAVSDFKLAKAVISPFTPEEIVKLRRSLDDTRKAKAYRPVRTVPRISSITVDLSPGAALPIARVLPGEMATLVFMDMTGNAWPLAAPPRVSDARSFNVEWLQDSASVVISATSTYEDGNLAVMLRGHATPVMVKLVTGEPDSAGKNRIVDYRLDLRIPGRAPDAPPPVAGAAKISLYDDVMQGFLDGLPPKEAIPVALRGEIPARTQAWQFDGALFLRTRVNIRSAFDQTMASGDGTKIYRLAPTPYVTLSDGDRSVIVELDIN